MPVTNKDGTTKEVIDYKYLGCNHHNIMSAAVQIAIKTKHKSSIVIIGLGGGGLCSFIRKFLPNTHITAVDVDADMLEVAKNWFEFKLDKMMSVKIQDGIKFLEEAANKGECACIRIYLS